MVGALVWGEEVQGAILDSDYIFILVYYFLNYNYRRGPGSMMKRYKAHCFELVLKDAGLILFRMETEFSARIWDWCQPQCEEFGYLLIYSDNPGLESQ